MLALDQFTSTALPFYLELITRYTNKIQKVTLYVYLATAHVSGLGCLNLNYMNTNTKTANNDLNIVVVVLIIKNC